MINTFFSDVSSHFYKVVHLCFEYEANQIVCNFKFVTFVHSANNFLENNSANAKGQLISE